MTKPVFKDVSPTRHRTMAAIKSKNTSIELMLRSEEEYRFYTELKRRTGTTLDDNESSAGFELGEIKVLFDEGQIQIFKDGKVAGNCSVTEFSRQPNATFRRLQRYAE